MLFPTSDNELIIRIRELKLNFFIGVLPEEKLARQAVVISVWMSSIGHGRHTSDDINAYASYADLIDRIKALADSGQHIELLETLAEKIAGLAFLDTRITKAVVAIDKPDIIPEAESVGVTIQRSRQA